MAKNRDLTSWERLPSALWGMVGGWFCVPTLVAFHKVAVFTSKVKPIWLEFFLCHAQIDHWRSISKHVQTKLVRKADLYYAQPGILSCFSEKLTTLVTGLGHSSLFCLELKTVSMNLQSLDLRCDPIYDGTSLAGLPQLPQLEEFRLTARGSCLLLEAWVSAFLNACPNLKLFALSAFRIPPAVVDLFLQSRRIHRFEFDVNQCGALLPLVQKVRIGIDNIDNTDKIDTEIELRVSRPLRATEVSQLTSQTDQRFLLCEASSVKVRIQNDSRGGLHILRCTFAPLEANFAVLGLLRQETALEEVILWESAWTGELLTASLQIPTLQFVLAAETNLCGLSFRDVSMHARIKKLSLTNWHCDLTDLFCEQTQLTEVTLHLCATSGSLDQKTQPRGRHVKLQLCRPYTPQSDYYF